MGICKKAAQEVYFRLSHKHHQNNAALKAISILLIAANWHASFSSKVATQSGTFNTTIAHICFLSWLLTELMNNVVLI